MYKIQRSPFIVPTTDGKYIAEHVGLATDGNSELSIAHMVAPPGWSEAPQKPTFTEYTLVVQGKKQIKIGEELIVLEAGQSIRLEPNVEVQYSNPFEEACVYVAICTPAFSVDASGR